MNCPTPSTVLSPGSLQNIDQAWNIYLKTLLQHSERGGATALSLKYRQDGYYQGCLSPHLTNRLIVALNSAPKILFDEDAQDPQWLSSCVSPKALYYLQASQRFHILTSNELWLIRQALEEMRLEISDALGSPWRVLSARAWQTHAQPEIAGPNDWHVDGLPPCLAKIMLYLTPLNTEYGGLAVRRKDGQELYFIGDAGSWIVFQNSVFYHRGIAPLHSNYVRLAIEITIAPALRFQLRPSFRGFNIRQPLVPWPTQRFIPFYESPR